MHVNCKLTITDAELCTCSQLPHTAGYTVIDSIKLYLLQTTAPATNVSFQLVLLGFKILNDFCVTLHTSKTYNQWWRRVMSANYETDVTLFTDKHSPLHEPFAMYCITLVIALCSINYEHWTGILATSLYSRPHVWVSSACLYKGGDTVKCLQINWLTDWLTTKFTTTTTTTEFM